MRRIDRPGRSLISTAVKATILAAYAGWLATTTPFSTTADLAVSVGLALAAAVATMSLVRRHANRPLPTVVTDSPTRSKERTVPRYIVWIIALSAFAMLELICFFAGLHNRFAFPTSSSIYNAASHFTAAKAIIVSLWIGLGWLLVRK